MTDSTTAIGIFLVGASAGALLDHIRFTSLAHQTASPSPAGARVHARSGLERMTPSSHQKQRADFEPYLWSLLTVGLAIGTVLAIPVLQHHVYFPIFYVVVATTAYLHGFRPALLALTASAVGIDFFIMPPLFGWNVEGEDLFRLSSFVGASMVIGKMVASTKSSAIIAPEKQIAIEPLIHTARVHPRFMFNAEVAISRASGLQVKGSSLDISESGISVMVPTPLTLEEITELEFTLPLGVVKLTAVVRQHRDSRYGLQFVHPSEEVLVKIRNSCCLLEKLG